MGVRGRTGRGRRGPGERRSAARRSAGPARAPLRLPCCP
ncbi:hypothetical protein BURPS406E_P0246 [Burkholderia pseudomallei 406e]|uniref:Uncharacterized protein n=2 Tax=pseudomallei group TaxID=111527 RepID=A2RZ92_BURM9|nr:hypothetical protein BMASAVP1_0923 [Burkholderia mallei SAVP1]ABM99459.2 hypothetical protein BMA10229_1209 [Burkholderia mallei NCTC 10229]ABN94424.1 hypothetical protein BURPS1106A_A0241 [Burkholderia pseudomallei 1106a]ABO03040.1 hypothetical protein BMA10247_A2185 [Burkholderia mallei NCTC 10247]EDK52763.1 hypothetical protein BMAFMH_G0194 [Burkholderia mallei FMH]EDK61974.1 hypothetical protein BMAJHU_I1151 [Burkholderia mallei JHU]EDO86466.1 hypothetical protein BURPS406E_P0246 [Burk